jgi:hypothetical protein
VFCRRIELESKREEDRVDVHDILMVIVGALIAAVVPVVFLLQRQATARANTEMERRLAAFAASGGNSVAALGPPKPVARECRNCQHFDLPEGQAALKNNPAFLAAGEALSPARMSVRVTGHDEKELPIYSEPCYPLRATWAEFGACMNKENGDPHLQWHEDSCQFYQQKVGA